MQEIQARACNPGNQASTLEEVPPNTPPPALGSLAPHPYNLRSSEFRDPSLNIGRISKTGVQGDAIPRHDHSGAARQTHLPLNQAGWFWGLGLWGSGTPLPFPERAERGPGEMAPCAGFLLALHTANWDSISGIADGALSLIKSE